MIVFTILNIIISVVFGALTMYQPVFSVFRLLNKRKRYPEAKKQCRYAALIAARNEEKVIGHLVDSIRAQDYPSELVDIYVVADNCDDRTAEIAEEKGAKVFVRKNRRRIGKGYAIEFLLEKIRETVGVGKYDGFFVFDADNLLDKNYIKEMNRVFSNGNKIVTCYRNTKNFGDNWVTGGYGIYFLRESEHLNSTRDYINASCFVSGTGYLFAAELLGGDMSWKWFCLTEDLEFSADMITSGNRVAYCGSAVIYDEQPRGFKASLVQRRRWIKGYFQVLKKHGKKLLDGLFKKKLFACFDMLMNMAPLFLTVFSLIFNIAMLLIGIISDPAHMWVAIVSFSTGIGGSYLILLVLGLFAVFTEHKNIKAKKSKIILYTFTFPLFIFSFCISVVMAVFGKVVWVPVKHSDSVSIDDMTSR